MLRFLGRQLAAYLTSPGHSHSTSPVTDVEHLRRVLRPGDVLLVEGSSRVSVAIKYLTQSTWSHAAMYVGEVLACAPETLFGWKLHGLAEFGRGKWRAKDLYDLDLLWRHGALDRDATRAAVELAFSSRALPLSALDDFRARPTWGQSFGGNRKWRALRKANPQITDDQTATRDRLRFAIDTILGDSPARSSV